MATTVLLIDDSATIRSVVKVHLMGHALEFVEADTAERGLQVLQLVVVELVIADVNMPGMSGIEFVRVVRSNDNPRLRQLPILLLTSSQAPELQAQALAVGANALLHKPVSSAKLIEALAALLPALAR